MDLKKARIGFGFVLSLLIILAFFIQISLDNQIHYYSIFSLDGDNSVELSKDNSVVQDFTLENKQIKSFKIFSFEKKKLNNFHIHYEVYKNDKKVTNGSVRVKSVVVGEDITLNFKKKIKRVKGKNISVHLSTNSDESLLLKSDENNHLSLMVVSNELSTFYKVSIAIGAIVALFGLFSYIYIFILHWELDKLFFIALFIFGFLINFLIPLGNVPDETYHFLTSFHYSNEILGIHEDITNITIRQCDKDIFEKYEIEDDYKVEMYLQDLFDQSNVKNKLVKSNKACLEVKKYSFTYYLSAIGITIGRMCGLNTLLCAFIGRFFNYLFFAIISYICIKKLSIFKEVFMFVCLLPITLQQAFSLSYDGIVLTFAIVISALTIKLYYDGKLSKKEHFILTISCVLISLCKGFAYTPIVLAPLSFYVFRAYDKNKSKIKPIHIVSALFIILCLGILGIIFFNKTTTEGSMMYLCGHPILLLKWIKGTAVSQSKFIMKTAFGTILGLCRIGTFQLLLLYCISNLIYILICTNIEKFKISWWIRILFVLMFLVIFFGTFLAMYTWTYKINAVDFINGHIINGIQGRYFIPLMPLLFVSLCFNKKEHTNLKSISLYNEILYCVLSIISIIVQVG